MDSTISHTPGEPDIKPVSIVREMRTSFLDYAMSVIVARALPDVRDGLKPVHRRILWGAHESGFVAGKPYRKCARIVGDVMGKYHPHGDSSIYEALVRMAQDWSMRVPLVDGQGNFGSMDPDKAAAMRYTEARLAKVANELLDDIDKDTVDFVDNYDGSESEPSVLPARYPNLLVNGAGGIAVGMATNIPPHNLGEVIDACRAYLDNNAITIDELMAHLPAPDFPTGALLVGTTGLRSAYHTGRGSIIMRARAIVEEGRGDRRSIVLTEIPYQLGKNGLVEKLAEAVKDKRIEGVSDIRDESSREGVRVVLDLKRDAVSDVVLNQIYRHTPAQSTFAINMLAIRGGRPELLNLKDIIEAFIKFREEVITRRSKFELAKARERAHLLLGLMIAVANLDEVVAMIRASATPALAREALLARAWPMGDIRPYLGLVDATEAPALEDVSAGDTYRLSDLQVRAILDLRLQKLTALGRDEIASELKELAAQIVDLLDILGNRARLYSVLRAELDAVGDQFTTKRRTEVIVAGDDIDDEDLIAREEMVVTVTMTGYIKRVALSEYRAQRRGGKGRSGMATKDEDIVTNLFVAMTHTPVLFFSSAGKVYRLKVWKLPLSSPQAKGRFMKQLLPLADDETITTVLPLPEDEGEWGRLHVMFATAHGSVRRNSMDAFTNIQSNGKLAIRFEEGDADRLIAVALCEEGDDVFLAARGRKAIRFPVDDVREFVSRTSTGVRGMTLAVGDEVISMSILKRFDATPQERDDYLKAAAWKESATPLILSETRQTQFSAAEEFILTITANGYGKRSSAFEYRRSGRGGQGIANIADSERNGPVVASFPATDTDQLMLVTDQGKLIRTLVSQIRIMGRGAQGVTLFNVAEDEHVVSAARISDEDDADDGVDTDEPAVDDVATADAADDGATEPDGQ
jgi:DNA gyrase subunit A